MATSTEIPASQYMRPAEACALLRCGRTFLAARVREGRLTALRPSRRMTLYRREEVEALAESAGVRAAA